MSKFQKALEVAGQAGASRTEKKQTVIPLKGIETTSSSELIVVQDPQGEIAEYFRFLRSLITRPPEGEPPKTILVTSALSGEGKTFVASNLAASIGQSLEDAALIIDADLRKPKIHKLFPTRSQSGGLSCLLAENIPLQDLVEKTSVEKLLMLRAGNCGKNPAELLSSEKMRKSLLEARQLYPDHFVIIDSSPLEMTPETAVIVSYVDAVVLVVRYAKTPRHCVRSAMEKIPKEKLLGIVFNASEKEGRRRYGGYHYKYGYGKYGHDKKEK